MRAAAIREIAGLYDWPEAEARAFVIEAVADAFLAAIKHKQRWDYPDSFKRGYRQAEAKAARFMQVLARNRAKRGIAHARDMAMRAEQARARPADTAKARFPMPPWPETAITVLIRHMHGRLGRMPRIGRESKDITLLYMLFADVHARIAPGEALTSSKCVKKPGSRRWIANAVRRYRRECK